MNFLKHYIKKIFSLAKRLSRKFATKEVNEETVQREHEIAVETLKKSLGYNLKRGEEARRNWETNREELTAELGQQRLQIQDINAA